MSDRTTEDQIRELARELEPVRPVPRLRSALAATFALGLLGVGGHWLLGGPGLRVSGGTSASLPFLVTLTGLVLVALGGLVTALAMAVPGREATARRAIGCAALGLVIAVLPGLWTLASRGTSVTEIELGECISCIGRSFTLGVTPLLLACAFMVRAALRRPGLGAAIVLAGGVALGAAAVHTTCPSDSPAHWLLAHALAPLAAMLVLTAPLAALLRRHVTALPASRHRA